MCTSHIAGVFVRIDDVTESRNFTISRALAFLAFGRGSAARSARRAAAIRLFFAADAA